VEGLFKLTLSILCIWHCRPVGVFLTLSNNKLKASFPHALCDGWHGVTLNSKGHELALNLVVRFALGSYYY